MLIFAVFYAGSKTIFTCITFLVKIPSFIENEWEKCGILEALQNGVLSDDPFEQV